MNSTKAILILILFSLNVLAEEIPTLKTDNFGINLGMNLKDLAAKCRQVGLSADLNKWSFNDKDHPGIIVGLNGAVNGNKSISETRVSAFKERVYDIELIFKDSSLRNYEVIKEALEKKYGKDKAGMFDAMETKSRFSTTIDGQAVTITLNHDISFNDQGGVLTLSYSYDAIVKLVSEELQRRKASKIEGDL